MVGVARVLGLVVVFPSTSEVGGDGSDALEAWLVGHRRGHYHLRVRHCGGGVGCREGDVRMGWDEMDWNEIAGMAVNVWVTLQRRTHLEDLDEMEANES